MALIYVTENGSVVGINGGTITVKKNEEVKEFPRETVEAICIFGNSQITAQCLRFCFENEITVSYFSGSGRYYGKVSPSNRVLGERLIKQVHLSEDETYCREIARKIVWAKISNQLVVAKRYLREHGGNPQEELFQLRNARRKVLTADSLKKILGYEGIAARKYFKIISGMLDPCFKFNGRNRPATDPVNSMLNFGYSLLLREMAGELENRGLSAYIGIMHTEHDKMPSLACDLIEEWRPIIVDSVVLSMLTRREVSADMFSYDYGLCSMTLELIKKLLSKLEEKMHTETSYLTYLKHPVSFRSAIWHQAAKLAASIDSASSKAYLPMIIR